MTAPATGMKGLLHRHLLMPMGFPQRLSGCLAVLLGIGHAAFGQAVSWPAFYFTNVASTSEWVSPHDCQVAAGSNGLHLEILGSNPYIHGPARDYPMNQPGWLRIRLQSSQSGTAQIFWYRDGAREADSIRFAVPETNGTEFRLPLPALGPGYHLRFDPPGDGGTCDVASIVTEPRVVLAEPAWIRPPEVFPAPTPLGRVQSGDLEWQQTGPHWGEWVLTYQNEPIAQGNPRSLLGWMNGTEVHWLELSQPVQLKHDGDSSAITWAWKNPSGQQITLNQSFTPGRERQTISVETQLTSHPEIGLVSVPVLVMHPRSNVFASEPAQALFSGIEFLEQESSSSEKNLKGPQALRRVPSSGKLTLPLIAIASKDRWLALDWTPAPEWAALFDAPDRIWNGTGAVFGLIVPGSSEPSRADGAVLPNEQLHLEASRTLRFHATLSAGLGGRVRPAIQSWVGRHPLPDPVKMISPDTASNFLDLEAHGWLDSRLRQGNRYAHAVGANFGAQPAADAALWMEWLSQHVRETGLAQRLRTAARAALAEVPPDQWSSSQIGHIRQPLIPLVFGHVPENLLQLEREASQLVSQLGASGTPLYKPTHGHPDLSETHGSREANGLAAAPIRRVLEIARITGDPSLQREGIRLLHTLDRWKNSVPRGAQSWEVPLHAPDILAAAHLVDCYRLGYELTQDPDLWATAEDWVERRPVCLSGRWQDASGRPVCNNRGLWGHRIYRAQLDGPAGSMVRLGLRPFAAGTQPPEAFRTVESTQPGDHRFRNTTSPPTRGHGASGSAA